MKEIIIGITDCKRFSNYEKWMTQEPGVRVIQLGYKCDNFHQIKSCQGIVLSGGEDVHPRFYNKPENFALCHQNDMDEKRDAFELKVLHYTQEQQLPLLGICRGLQITNVFFGGTLIPDIPSAGKRDHSKLEEGHDRYHHIEVKESSLLEKIAGKQRGEVNSAHHQSTDALGDGLCINATSEDGVIEGLERENPEGKPFLLLVQWHPERITAPELTFAENIRKSFLEAVRNEQHV